jgi:hypothetical protein
MAGIRVDVIENSADSCVNDRWSVQCFTDVVASGSQWVE